MDRPKEKSWCNDIVLPSAAGSLGDGLSYLDRMIAGGDPSQRQFMTSGTRTHGPKQNKGNKKNNTLPNRKFGGKRPLECKPLDVNIDDDTWIADRKKKFPKIKCHQDESGLGSDQLNTNRPLKLQPDEKGSEVVSSNFEDASKSNDKVRRKRKMTLFEKLTQMDDQSS